MNGHQLHYVSCQVEGHASWDRCCPTFIQKCDEMSGRLTENHMPYFPTDEPWTHIVQLPRITHLPAPPMANMYGPLVPPRRMALRQTMLRFPATQQPPSNATQPMGPPSPTRGALATGANMTMQRLSCGWGDQDGDNGLPPTMSLNVA